MVEAIAEGTKCAAAGEPDEKIEPGSSQGCLHDMLSSQCTEAACHRAIHALKSLARVKRETGASSFSRSNAPAHLIGD